MENTENKRLLSLDVLRGFTIAGMILVNNPGSWSYVYAPLGHAAWNGLTPTDLIFPFFMFIMGISTFLSLKKFDFKFSYPTFSKIIKRSAIIFLIGIGLSWFALSMRTFNKLPAGELDFFHRLIKATSNFEHLRILGVMQRLGLAYGGAAIIAIFLNHKKIPYLIAITLLGYFLLLLFGNGFEFSQENIVSKIDRAILGANHMYIDNGVVLDPEGLLSTIPSICHVLIGFCCGKLLTTAKDKLECSNKLFVIGCVLSFAGFLLSYACPINKKIWSPTFVLTSCGLAASFLALLIWIIDIKNKKKWSVFFESFGANPLFIYVASGILAILIGNILISFLGETMSIKSFIYKVCLQPYLGNYVGSVAFSILFVGINWAIGNILYKKKIYIKI